jgi:polysaccharide biosynthesis transport protein
MSRIFEALRKSQQAIEEPLPSPNPVREAPEELVGLQSVASERVQVRPGSRIIVHTDPSSFASDRFRLLRTRLRERFGRAERRILLLTSALPQDGKSTIALNLATALAERGRHTVLLLEADLHRPSLTHQLGARSWPGLAECLEGKCDPQAALRRIEPLGWYFLSAGVAVGNPVELVHSERLSLLVKGLATHFDWILMDAPPANPVADILALKAHVDGCLLVARAGQTPREAIEEAVQHLGREHVLGIILNGVEGLDKRYSRYYGRYYGQWGQSGSGPGDTLAE